MMARWQLLLLLLCVIPGGESMRAPSKIKELGEAVNGFAVDLYKELTDEFNNSVSENMIFSPMSISTALAMTYLGTDGATAKEMADVLKFSDQTDRWHSLFKNLLNKLNSASDDFALKAANRIYPDEKFPMLPKYLNRVRNFYKARPTVLPLQNDPTHSAERINNWVSNKTEGKIPQLLSPDDITSDTLLILVNAIYFKGVWLSQFDPMETKNETFNLCNGENIIVEMMYNKSNYRTAFDPYLQADVLELPYVGEKINMVILLPRRNVCLADLEAKLTAESLKAALNRLVDTSVVNVKLPKFKTKLNYNLKEHLEDMGMRSAFGMDANFRNLCGNTCQVTITHVIHEAFIEVNEEGTEAAAASAVFGGKSTPIEKHITMDHPFIYLIRDMTSGAILFMGRMAKPNEILVPTTPPSTTTATPTISPTSTQKSECEGQETEIVDCRYMHCENGKLRVGEYALTKECCSKAWLQKCSSIVDEPTTPTITELTQPSPGCEENLMKIEDCRYTYCHKGEWIQGETALTEECCMKAWLPKCSSIMNQTTSSGLPTPEADDLSTTTTTTLPTDETTKIQGCYVLRLINGVWITSTTEYVISEECCQKRWMEACNAIMTRPLTTEQPTTQPIISKKKCVSKARCKNVKLCCNCEYKMVHPLNKKKKLFPKKFFQKYNTAKYTKECIEDLSCLETCKRKKLG
ncbi:unnamed protein product [Owenia fusiformis]|uniref:Serpin domain-containing protein n=1 Tax=Owenia fusiformis TaxID=6347 RepID=A0A8S4Q4F6_OWEFU|nr:unnamed protein product [Owenia fusiformis]